VVGVNRHQQDEEELEILHIDPALEGKQLERLEKTKAARSSSEVEARLDDLRKAAEAEGNLMYPIIEASRALATEGEMITALQDVFGTYTETPVF
jgi:methylmalonyl-CoA mutase N-terminal domain/subunit